MRRYALPFAMIAVLAVHLALMLYFEPPSLILSDEPVPGLDYESHMEQTVRAVEAHRRSGRIWCYDPHLLAGQPSGAIFDADNKLIEVFAIVLDRFGVPIHRSFNLFIWLAHGLVPLVFYASARLFRLDRSAAVGAAFLASMGWYFDALSHWFFWAGMIAWGFAAYLWVLPLALFYRWLDARRPWLLVSVFLLLGVIQHLHAYAFFLLVVPMTYLYWRARKSMGRWDHLAVWAVAIGVVAVNGWWLAAAMRFWHYILTAGYYLDATPDYLLYDYLGLLKEADIHGLIAVRAGFRFLIFGAAALWLITNRRKQDDRYVPLLATLGVLLFIAYFGGLVAPLREIQPYRFVIPAMYLATFPAALWIAEAVRSLKVSRPSPAALGVMALASFVALPKLARDVLYFIPDWIPGHTRPLPAPDPDVSGGRGFGTIAWKKPLAFRHEPMDEPMRQAIENARKAVDGKGRWLVEWWPLGERLAWATDAQILGGFRDINLAHSDANLFRKYPDGAPPDPDELGRYLERYNVQWVIVGNPKPKLESRNDVLEFAFTGLGQRVYRTRNKLSWFLDGSPGDVKAEVDLLTITGSRGGDLVLKYHYMETLECRPRCEIYRAEVPNDRVGFIGVRNAPSDFEIVNP